MEKKINEKEMQLQEWLEVKDFNRLNFSEKELVLRLISESEYTLRRAVILSAQSEQSKKVLPLPLILPAEETKIMVIPVYQAALAVAATIVIMLLLKFPFEIEKWSSTASEIQYVTKVDTVYSEKVIRDTLYKVIEKPTIVEKKVYDTRTVVEYVYTSSPLVDTQILYAPNYDIVPDLAKISAEVDGSSSMSSDNTLDLAPNVIWKN